MNKKKNKAVDLGVREFMTDVKETGVKAKSLENEVVQDDLADAPKDAIEEDVEKVQQPQQSDSKPGRPKKKSAILRVKQKTMKFDEEFSQQLALIKAIHEIDLQDFVYVAAEKFRDEYFPKGKATKEGLAIIREALKRINGE